jgi:hypothetical protein
MKTLILSALAALLLAPALSAQPISGAELDDLFDSEPQVEVNLSGSLLRLAAAATREDEPETAAMIDGLRRITVRIYPSPLAERVRAVRRLEDIGRLFERDGWQTLVRVRSLPNDDDSDGDVWVYVRDEGDVFGGLAVMTVDDEDENVVFVLIDGLIDPDRVGALTRRFGNVNLDVYEDDDE